MKNDIASLVKAAISKATIDFRKEKRTTSRRERLGRSSRERLYKRHYAELSIKAAAFQVMEQAYMQASVSNTLPANARQIMYQARPLIQKLTTKMWKNDSLFTQDYLPRFIREHRALTKNWDVVYDARGHLEEPHTQRRIELGTVNVREYVNDWHRNIPPLTIAEIGLGINTDGPANRYGYVLFIEKEGFSALFERSQIGKRYDIAIMSNKGMSVTASRQLVEALSARGVSTLSVHDFDASGLTICRTLQEDTQRYQFSSRPNVKCLGLRLADALAMGLESESFDCKSTERELKKCGATDEEIDFLSGGQRVELNAMTSGQFIEWLERKFEELGVKKVVPDQATLEAAYKRSILVRLGNQALAKVQQQWNENREVEVPADLPSQIRDMFSEDPKLSWDEAIKMIQGK